MMYTWYFEAYKYSWFLRFLNCFAATYFATVRLAFLGQRLHEAY